MEKIGYGKRLKEARKYIGLTQQQIAEKLNFEWHKIKDIEAEKLKLSAETAVKIEEIYSINGWWLLTGKGEMRETKNKETLEEKEKEIIESYRKLPEERKKYYYHKIIAESLDD